MATLRSRFGAGWNKLFGGGNAAAPAVPVPAGPTPLHLVPPSDPYEAEAARVRETVAAFEEDKETPLGAGVLGLVHVACYVGPLVLAFFVARILAAVLIGPGVDPLSMFVICLIAEVIQAGCALALPRGIVAWKRDAAKRAITIVGMVVFAFLVVASVLAQYVALSEGKAPGELEQVMIVLRAGIPVVADIGATVILVLLRKKTLQRFLDETEKKGEAVDKVSVAQMRLKETSQEASMRQKERDQYLEGKERMNNLIVKLQEVQNAAIIRIVEEAADGNRGNGGQRRIGGGSSY
jgi:hypothetical protein